MKSVQKCLLSIPLVLEINLIHVMVNCDATVQMPEMKI